MKQAHDGAAMRRRATFVALAASAALLVVPSAEAAYRCNNGGALSGDRCLELVAKNASGSAAGTLYGDLSAAGNHVALTTSASMPGNTATGQQVYVKDLVNDTYTLVSRAGGAAGAPGSGISAHGKVSSNGNVVAFLSLAKNLIPLDNSANLDLFVRNISAGTTVKVTTGTNPVTGADGDTVDLAISADGSKVVFTSFASNLVSGDSNGAPDVFVANADGTGLALVSVASGGAAGNNASYKPAISADGRYVAFASDATNLIASDTNGHADVFVRDLVSNTTTRVSVGPGGVEANNRSGQSGVSISADGNRIAFETRATNLGPADGNSVDDIAVVDRTAGTVTYPGYTGSSQPSLFPSISGDGSVVSFRRGQSASPTDIYVAGVSPNTGLMRVDQAFNGATGTSTPLSSSATKHPWNLSSDGTVLLLETEVAVAASDTNTATDLYMHIVDLRGPTVTAPAAGSFITNDNTQTISATLQGRGNALVARDASNAIVASFQTTAPSNSVTVDTVPLADGAHTLSIREVRPPYASAPVTRTFTVDTVAPQSVAVVSPANGATITDAVPQLSGTAGTAVGDAANVTVEVRNSSNALVGTAQSVPVQPNGSWSIASPELPSNGTYTVHVSQSDHATNVSNATSGFTLNAAAPVITITSPAAGVIANASPTLTGTLVGAPGGSVTVNAGAPIPFTASSGSWSVPLNLSPDGTYSVVVSATNVAGTTATPAHVLTVDTTAPTGVGVTSPLNNATVGAQPATIAGTAGTATGDAASVSVKIKGPAPATTQIGSTLTGSVSGGAWSVAAPALPSNGTYTIEVSQGDHAGNSTTVTTTFNLAIGVPTITIDLVSPGYVNAPAKIGNNAAQTVQGTITDAASLTLKVTGPTGTVNHPIVASGGSWSKALNLAPDGLYTIEATSSNFGGEGSSGQFLITIDTTAPNAPQVTNPAHGSVLPNSNIAVGGTGEPGATLTLYKGATVLGTTTVGPGGTWQVSSTFANGSHAVHAVQVDQAMLTSPQSNTLTFTIDPSSVQTIITTPLANSTVGSKNVTVAGKAAAGGTVQVYLVQGASLVAQGSPVAVDGNGGWSKVIRLDDGTYTVRGVETGSSTATNDRTFTVRSGVPVITSPASNAIVGSNFAVKGTALPNAAITVKAGSSTLGTGTANGAGAWSVPVTRPDGPVTLRAYAGSGASQTEDSDPVSIVVDANGPEVVASPDAPVMGTLAGTPVRISGSATDLHRITGLSVRYVNSLTGQSVTASAPSCTGCGSSSSITFSDSTNLAPGLWRAIVTAVDEVGNTGVPGGTSFIVMV